MKQISLLIFASLFSFSAFADVLAVECTAPKMLTGGASIQLADLVSSEKSPEGYDVYRGQLKVRIGGSTAKPVFDGTVDVQGVALNDGALHLAASNSEISTIYMNPDVISTVEMKDGKVYNTECRFY